jgi:hypothetical protein
LLWKPPGQGISQKQAKLEIGTLYLDLALDKIRKEEGSKIERKKNGSRSREFKMGTKSITLRIHNNVLLLLNRSLSSFFQQICLSLCLL